MQTACSAKWFTPLLPSECDGAGGRQLQGYLLPFAMDQGSEIVGCSTVRFLFTLKSTRGSVESFIHIGCFGFECIREGIRVDRDGSNVFITGPMELHLHLGFDVASHARQSNTG